MKDEEYVFRQEIAEKKQAARGAYHKVRGGGKTVKMPSDYMTRKEKNSLNGEVKTYAMSKPLTWYEFSRMPDEIQVTYIRGLVDKYSAPPLWVAQMLGINPKQMHGWCFDHSFSFPSQPGRKLAKMKPLWEEFIAGTRETPQDRVSTPEPGNDAPDNITALIALLRGTGAKLTIEVTL